MYENNQTYILKAGEDLRNAKGLALKLGKDGRLYKTKKIKDIALFTIPPNISYDFDTTGRFIEVISLKQGIIPLNFTNTPSTGDIAYPSNTVLGKAVGNSNELDGNRIGVVYSSDITGSYNIIIDKYSKLNQVLIEGALFHLEDGTPFLLENGANFRLQGV
jgi:hypothetical protein